MLNQTKANASFLCIELLESFTKKELQKFKLFIESPYFNTDDKLIGLFEIIRKEVLNKAFTVELQRKMYIKIYEDKADKNLSEKQKKVLRAKLSILNQLAHQFLVNENLAENKNCFNDLLYASLLEKRQFKAFQIFIKRDKNRLSLIEKKENQDFEHLYKMDMHQFEYLFLSGLLYKKPKYKMNEIVYSLDTQYLIKKISLYIMFFSNKFLQNNESLDVNPLNLIKNLSELSQFKTHANLVVLQSTLDFLRNSNKEGYDKLINLLIKYKNHVSTDELKGFYLIVINFLNDEIKKGSLEFEKDFVELYFLLDTQNLLLDQNMMQAVKLKNITVTMCRGKAFGKAKYFTNKYIEYVRKGQQNNVYNFCFSIIAFYEKEYEKALDYIVQVESVNFVFEINHRLLMMKIYYERGNDYSEKTERFYRSAEKFFSDNKLLSQKDKKSYKNFTQILINLYRFKHHEGRMTIEKLQTKLEQQEYNIDKKWLLEKIQELKK